MIAYDKNGTKFDEFDESKIIALHKFDLNRNESYNFEYECIFSIHKSKIIFDNNHEIFEVFYKGLTINNNYYTKKYYLICEIGSLNKFLSENFNSRFKTYFENINSYGHLYIENKTIKYGLESDEIDTVYVFKDNPIIQFSSSKGYKFEGIDKYTNYNVLII